MVGRVKRKDENAPATPERRNLVKSKRRILYNTTKCKFTLCPENNEKADCRLSRGGYGVGWKEETYFILLVLESRFKRRLLKN